jgi:aminoglycoside phosphotransferase (APT) family kinase protein
MKVVDKCTAGVAGSSPVGCAKVRTLVWYSYDMLEIGGRKDVFYWQTDRELSVEDYEKYFLKRHELSSEDILNTLQNGIQSVQGHKEISVVEPDENVLKGNVNVVRKVLINGEPYVARLHPRGIRNGYFYVEKLALDAAKGVGLPAPKIIEIHEALDEQDMSFALMTTSPGVTMEVAIKENPDLEPGLLRQAGILMAKVHEIEVEKFGSFDNELAKREGRLVGLHDTYKEFIWSGLEENLQRLGSFNVIDLGQAVNYKKIFETYNFEPLGSPRLIHNDFADWNILVDGDSISAILDWDECHAGDPIADLACWSTFFGMDRFKIFLEGYQSNSELPEDFDERFHFYRLRYTISKMALRVKRAQVDKSPFLQDKIKIGEQALKEESAWFSL